MVYRSMQGKEVDIEKLMRQNELVPAIGNMKVNARGDELGAGGIITKSREDVVADYYDTNPKAVAKTGTPVLTEEMPAAKPMLTQSVKSKKPQIEE